MAPAAGCASLVSSYVLDDNGRDDLVRERLPLRVPQREQVPDVADDPVDDVAQVAHERHARADRLAGVDRDELDVGDLLAETLAGGAAVVPAVVDGPAEPDQGEQVVENTGLSLDAVADTHQQPDGGEVDEERADPD